MEFEPIDWFLQTLEDTLHIKVEETEVALEAVILFKEEVGLDVYPESLEVELPDPILFETFLYEYNDDQWLGVVALDEDYNEIYYCRIFKNDRILYTWIIKEE